MGVEDPEAGSETELRLIFAFLCVDHKPCIERFNAFELYLDTCERNAYLAMAQLTHRDLHDFSLIP